MSTLNEQIDKLTRACVLTGIDPTKWVTLVQHLAHNQAASTSTLTVGQSVCDSLFVLHRTYDSEAIIDYFRLVILMDMLDLPTFLSNFLVKHMPVAGYNLPSLRSFVQLVIEVHFASPKTTSLPVSFVPEVLTILKNAYTSSLSPFDTKVLPIAQFVILVISLAGNVSELSTHAAAECYTLCSDVLQIFELPADIRTSLEGLLMSIGLVLGDETKTTREVEVAQPSVSSASNHTLVNASVGSNIAAISLMLHHFVLCRGSLVGCNNGDLVVSLFSAYFAIAQLSLATFHMQIILASLDQYAQSSSQANTRHNVKNFTLARLPRILQQFNSNIREVVGAECDPGRAMESAMIEIVHSKSDTLSQCEVVLDNASESKEQVHPTFMRRFCEELVECDLISSECQTTVLSILSGEPVVAQPHPSSEGYDFEAQLLSKLSEGLTPDEFSSAARHVLMDDKLHHRFANALLSKFNSFPSSMELEALSCLCRFLSSSDGLMDVLALHVSLVQVIAACLVFLEDFDCETVGDPQSAVSQLGHVVLFVQRVSYRYKLKGHSFVFQSRACNTGFLNVKHCNLHPMRLKAEDPTFAAWATALFDKGSEGIEDNLLRTTKPLTLLQFAPSLVSYAIMCRQRGIIDADIQRSGISFFLGALLNWTLAGILNGIISDISRYGYNAPIHFEVLLNIVRAKQDECPDTVRLICGHGLLRLLADRRMDLVRGRFKVNDAPLKQALTPYFKIKPPGPASGSSSQSSWCTLPRLRVQEALAQASTGRACHIDIPLILHSTGPRMFLEIFWSELCSATILGDLHGPRQIGLFVLTTSLPPPNAELLPIFIDHISLKFAITSRVEDPSAQMRIIELLAALIASALMVKYHTQRLSPGKPSMYSTDYSALTKSMIVTLHGSNHPMAALLSRQITAFPSFSNFFLVSN